jgi:transposase InsO family protein
MPCRSLLYPPTQEPEKRSKHGSILSRNLGPSRVNSQSKSTHKVTTDSNHRLGVAANWLDGDFAADVPNHKWAGDITYIWTAEGWLYLAVILDLHSRRVVALRQAQEGCQRQDEEGSGDQGTRYGGPPPPAT